MKSVDHLVICRYIHFAASCMGQRAGVEYLEQDILKRSMERMQATFGSRLQRFK